MSRDGQKNRARMLGALFGTTAATALMAYGAKPTHAQVGPTDNPPCTISGSTTITCTGDITNKASAGIAVTPPIPMTL